MDTTTFRPAKPLFGKPPAFPLPVPTKTLRTLSPSKLPLSRPHHARTNSTPTTVRHRAASTVKRTPLTDKTEDSLASFVPSPFIPEEPFSAEETGEQVYDQNMRDRATTTRVALNFGSDDDTTKDRRPYSRGGGKSRSRGRSRDSTATRDRSRSRGVGSVCGRRPRAAPRAATPARLPQACDIPYTVARKKWDF
ncbi:hypothetical protein BDW02DRAFT_123770 [Decorospora gaudefroyi]|uniref:Uncharacterized protein n=1 Tax=Decorospora gaudefroyi TaxID=184978 RepID=A0A6A5K5G7_9PLEO|nr:hypothetical protein BDW02DRAFT_123770 [Decorospora gaudefroyi]